MGQRFRSTYKMLNTVAERRKLLNLTQSQLAEMCDVRSQTISNIETGQYQPSAYLAGMLCKALLCSFEDLFIFVPLDKE